MKKYIILLAVGILLALGDYVYRISTKPDIYIESTLKPDSTLFQLSTFDEGTGLPSEPIRMSDIAGRPVLINFWASWCEACVPESTLLRELKARNKDLLILGVAVADDLSEIAKDSHHKGLFDKILLDPDKRFAKSYSVEGIPASLLLNQTGVAELMYRRPLDRVNLERISRVAAVN